MHAIWSLYQLVAAASSGEFRGPRFPGLADADADVRGQAARALGEFYAIRKNRARSAVALSIRCPALVAEVGRSRRLGSAARRDCRRSVAQPTRHASCSQRWPKMTPMFALPSCRPCGASVIGVWPLSISIRLTNAVRSGVLLALTGQYTDGAVAALAAAAQRAREAGRQVRRDFGLGRSSSAGRPLHHGLVGNPAGPLAAGSTQEESLVRHGDDCRGNPRRSRSAGSPGPSRSRARVSDTQDAQSVEAVRRILSADEHDEVVCCGASPRFPDLKDTACATRLRPNRRRFQAHRSLAASGRRDFGDAAVG